MKKAVIIILAMVFALSLSACGSSSAAFVTYEDYQTICEEDWMHMTPDDVEEYLGVKGDETENSLGEGYMTILYPGEVEDTGLLVTFSDLDGDGTYYCNGLSPSGLEVPEE